MRLFIYLEAVLNSISSTVPRQHVEIEAKSTLLRIRVPAIMMDKRGVYRSIVYTVSWSCLARFVTTAMVFQLDRLSLEEIYDLSDVCQSG